MIAPKFDAILIQSFGGPEGMDDVMPFLRNVTRGRNIPDERLKVVAHHYELFGGVSPINEQNRQLIKALEDLLKVEGPHLPIYWGNRNWHPFLKDTVAKMRDDGIKRVVSFATSAYSSYSGCRQYLEDIDRALLEVGGEGLPQIEKLRAFFNHPLFVEANAQHLQEAIALAKTENFQLAFSAHSVPMTMANNCRYVEQLNETCRLVASAVGLSNFDLVFQSRSGPPDQEWLKPDICDYMKELPARGIKDLILQPIGFVSDHMEVIYDLDTEARTVADELSLNYIRAKTPGKHHSFVRMIRDLIMEKLDPTVEKLSIGSIGVSSDFCQPDCCPSGRPQGAPPPRLKDGSAS